MSEIPEPSLIHRDDGRVNFFKSKSPYGYNLAEVVSAVVKTMRRGKGDDAVFWSCQMMISGREAENFLWKRFRIFTTEDIGSANPYALGVVNGYRDLYFELEGLDRHVTGACAAMFLANPTLEAINPKKTRYVNELVQVIRFRLEESVGMLEIPDYALDLHLLSARKKGEQDPDFGLRDRYHYLTEAAKLEGDDERFSKKYKKELVERALLERRKRKSEK